MRRFTVLPLMLLLIAVAGASLSAASVPDPGSLQAANRALKGHRATIELENGEVLKGARKVVLGSEHTTWTLGSESREVATADVERVVIEKRSRVKKWGKRGLVAGAILGAVGIGYSSEDGVFAETRDVEDVAAGAAVGAAVGVGAGALAGERVVFEATD